MLRHTHIACLVGYTFQTNRMLDALDIRLHVYEALKHLNQSITTLDIYKQKCIQALHNVGLTERSSGGTSQGQEEWSKYTFPKLYVIQLYLTRGK